MLAILLFIITAAGLYFLIAGVRKSINGEDPFFFYIYSIAVLTIAIGVYIYIAFSDFISTFTTVENVTFQLTILWLIASLIGLAVLITDAVKKRPVITSGIISGISVSMFLVTLSLYASMKIL